eukprot:2215400-Rhodomonas_salina.1
MSASMSTAMTRGHPLLGGSASLSPTPSHTASRCSSLLPRGAAPGRIPCAVPAPWPPPPLSLPSTDSPPQPLLLPYANILFGCIRWTGSRLPTSAPAASL